ncbi:23S rRNA (adenine(2503)-C(2))-methyltransferase RlmN [Massiliimalia massiliensis]|uniref:23S rRNA (adenine(2503)-C(2))-methyltransferase RlmN n=1 Tax=Massiliimalia massiliensis TaxID=1852384 RepID=UPI0009878FF3|nr:23S rRNA (adenine(2503)-C(2))-methyltransferase RlmN [Massiliimalia massiliensis]
MKKIDIKSFTLPELKAFLKERGEPAFRAGQVFDWIHVKKARGFEEMSNLPKALREKLADECRLPGAEIRRRLVSRLDGTVKYLYGLEDGESVETVLMKYEHGYSVCVSSQVGCKMGCEFCASTKAGFVRNLLPSEILDQIYQTEQDQNLRISHIVMMGIGEPLDNFENTTRFLELINSPYGANISMRNISLSTCGLAEKIDELAAFDLGLTLSISLHACTDEKRNEIMPVNRRYPIGRLLQSCKNYSKITRRRISFEYALMKGKNDSVKDAEQLACLLKGQLCHVNLIPVNEVQETSFEKTERQNIYRFQKELMKRGINATVRRTLGSDINAACGQLRRENLSEVR